MIKIPPSESYMHGLYIIRFSPSLIVILFGLMMVLVSRSFIYFVIGFSIAQIWAIMYLPKHIPSLIINNENIFIPRSKHGNIKRFICRMSYRYITYPINEIDKKIDGKLILRNGKKIHIPHFYDSNDVRRVLLNILD